MSVVRAGAEAAWHPPLSMKRALAQLCEGHGGQSDRGEGRGRESAEVMGGDTIKDPVSSQLRTRRLSCSKATWSFISYSRSCVNNKGKRMPCFWCIYS